MEFLRRLYFPIFILVVLFYGWRPMAGGEDFWAHAAIGRWVLEHGQAPHRTLFLWSADIPWVFHAYGSGVVFAALLQTGGPFLAVLFNCVMSALPFVLLWGLARRNGPISASLTMLFLMAAWVCWVRWRLRPELFTATFLTLVYLFFLAKERRLWHYAGLLLVFALWPNLHAGVAIGIMALWVGIIADSLQYRRLEWKLIAFVALCSLVPFVSTPYGLSYAGIFGATNAVTYAISEWKPFWVKPAFSPEYTLILFIPCVAALVLWWKNPERRWAVLGWLLMVLFLFLQARRQLWLFSLTSTMVIATAAPLLDSERIYRALKRQKDAVLDPPMRLIGRVGAIVILVCSITLAFQLQSDGFVAVPETAPVKMAEFLANEAPQGRIFNDYEYSAALEWFLDERRELYIDLINAYPPSILESYLETIGAEPKGLKFLDEQNIQVIALRPLNGEGKGDRLHHLYDWLKKSKQWKVIYDEKDGRVWARS